MPTFRRILLGFAICIWTAALSPAQDIPKELLKRALWEAEGLHALDDLPNREEVVRKALENDQLKRLIQIAPKTISQDAKGPFDMTELSVIMRTWWLDGYVQSLEQKVANGTLDGREVAREIMLDKLQDACIQTKEFRANPVVRCEYRMEERLKSAKPEEQIAKLGDTFDRIRRRVETVKTMASRHDRLAYLEKVLANHLSEVDDRNRATFRADVVIALFENGGGKDWQTAQGIEMLKTIFKVDYRDGEALILCFLTQRNAVIPDPLFAAIESKVLSDYNGRETSLFQDSVVIYTRGKPYPKVSRILKTIAANDTRPEAKAQALSQVLAEKQAEMEWVSDVLPASALGDIIKLRDAETLPREAVLASVTRLLALNDPLVTDLVARMSVSKNWFDNQLGKMIVEGGRDLSAGAASLVASKIVWGNTSGVEVLLASMGTKTPQIRIALLSALRGSKASAQRGYSKVITIILSNEPLKHLSPVDVVELMQIAANDEEKPPELSAIVEKFVGPDAPVLAQYEGERFFLNSLWVCGSLPGSAPRIKSTILEALKGGQIYEAPIAAAHALKSWPGDKALDADVVEAVSRHISDGRDTRANSDLSVGYMSPADGSNLSSLVELLEFVGSRKTELELFRPALKTLASYPKQKRLDQAERNPVEMAQELLK